MHTFFCEEGKPLREIVEGKNYPTIMYREMLPIDLFEGEDTLYGYCSYVDGELTSLDGDDYSLDDMIWKWEIDGDNLTVWVEAEYYCNGEWKPVGHC